MSSWRAGGRRCTSVFITMLTPRGDFHDPRLGCFFAGQFTDNSAFVKHKNAVADTPVFLDLRGGEDYGCTALGKVADETIDFGFRSDVHRSCRRHHEKDARSRAEPSAKNGLLLIAAAQIIDR